MSISIEWFTASSTSIDVLSASDEASDGQRAIDDGGTPQTIALELGNGGGGACITGTPMEVITFLTTCIREVADYWIEFPEGEPAIGPGALVQWEHEDGRTLRSRVVGVDTNVGMVIVKHEEGDDEFVTLTLGEVEVVTP